MLDDAKNVVMRKDYEPYGEVRAVTGEAPRQGYIGKEMDRESDLAMHGVRAYSASEGRFLSGDVLWENYRSLNPYHYAANNPVSLSDPDGRKTVSIHGADAEQVTRELDEATSLTLTRDPNTGQISATGIALTPWDNKLLDAIEDTRIHVNLNTTRYNDFPSIDHSTGLIMGGAFDGSVRERNGDIRAEQWINLWHCQQIATVGGGTAGQSVLHETNEAYIGAQMFPGQLYVKENYQAAHAATVAIDPPQGQVRRAEVHVGDEARVSAEGPTGTVFLYRYNIHTGEIIR